MPRIERYASEHGLAAAAAAHIVTRAQEAIHANGRFVLALAGGSTPQRTYQRLADPSSASQIEWSKVQICWGDERCVPPDHSQSNYRLAADSLLQQVPIPVENIHRIRGELAPAEAAQDYETELRRLFAKQDRRPQVTEDPLRSPPGSGTDRFPRFDLILLGLGIDGHTASLFPGSDALAERKRWVRAVFVPALNSWRITLTLPVLNAAGQVMFLVSGAEKSEALRRVFAGGEGLPAQRIKPAHADPLWLVDAASAALL